MKNLQTLANEYGSDKGTTGGRTPHRYTYIYDLLFAPQKEQDITFLEIGLCRGGPELGKSIDRVAVSPSVRMWTEYFTRADIVGFDISDFSHQQSERFTFIRGDCGKDEDVQRLAASRDGFDVIIDDASHASYHQQLVFKHLWPKLRAGGLYIIEDVNWQPPVYEESLPRVPVTATFFQTFLEEGELLENTVLTPEIMRAVERQTMSAAFFPSFKVSTSSRIKLMVLRKCYQAEA
ncbi:MAG TPA: class I SAM-dependent methyltransferase [Rhizomicrobium sp.]|jgi:hypothetical protein